MHCGLVANGEVMPPDFQFGQYIDKDLLHHPLDDRDVTWILIQRLADGSTTAFASGSMDLAPEECPFTHTTDTCDLHAC